jgi:hypothetical protein
VQRLLHTCAGVHIHPLQRQRRTTVHAAGRSQRGVPNLPRAASCGLCGNSKSGAMGSSRRLRPTCRLSLCAGCAGFGFTHDLRNGGVARRWRQFCRGACGLTRLARGTPRGVPTRSIVFSASGGSPGSYRPRRQSDRSSSQTQCECWCFTRTECYESRSRSSTFDGDGSRCPRVTAKQSQPSGNHSLDIGRGNGDNGRAVSTGWRRLRLEISAGMPGRSRSGGRVRFWNFQANSFPSSNLNCAFAEPGLP